MRTIEAETTIDAPPESVWAVLTDFRSYPAWNPFITRVEGEPRPGKRFKVRVEPPGSRGMTFHPRALALDQPEQFAWKGSLLVPNLFDGRHEFVLSPDDGRTRFVQRETFGGLLVPLLLDEESVRRGFEAMNAALKLRVEERDGKPEEASSDGSERDSADEAGEEPADGAVSGAGAV
ncbi:SRPBCC family protein [Halostella pelagica]|uniref:SRPBCC family protein n=1 Tax=Halostella pelagica TaxID=2583824 RepID=UPI001081EBDF|nr:SRPBCC domain-containing protein [Halostella pelagica]